MLKINKRSIEAVAALLYNSIYNLSHASEGAWCVEQRRDDPAYLAFAESLLQVVRAAPDGPDHDLIQQAVQLTNQNRNAGLAWATIVIDQEYASLSGETEKFFSEVRSFIKASGLINLESNFIDFDLGMD